MTRSSQFAPSGASKRYIEDGCQGWKGVMPTRVNGSSPSRTFLVRVAFALIVSILATAAWAQPTRTPASDAMAEFIEDASMASWFHVDPFPAFDFIEQVQPFVLDVRTEAEFEEGHIEGATRIYVTDLDTQLAALPENLDMPMIVYCTGGLHGTLALTYLRFVGYRQVRNLRGGFTAWRDAELPFTTR